MRRSLGIVTYVLAGLAVVVIAIYLIAYFRTGGFSPDFWNRPAVPGVKLTP